MYGLRFAHYLEGEVFIESLLGMDCRVSESLCSRYMTKEVVKGKLSIPKIMEEGVSHLTDPLGILT